MQVVAVENQWREFDRILKNAGCSSDEVTNAKTILSRWSKTFSLEDIRSIQTIYRLVLPVDRQERIVEIKKWCFKWVKAGVWSALTYTPRLAEACLRGLLSTHSCIDNKLRYLNNLGACRLVDHFFCSSLGVYTASAYCATIERMVSEMSHRFFDGVPSSFASMAYLLGKRKIGHVSVEPLLPDQEQSLQLLWRLCALGVGEARAQLCEINNAGHFGENGFGAPIGLTVEQRVEILRGFALHGHAKSQRYVGHICRDNRFFESNEEVGLSDETRRRYMCELQAREVPHNVYITTMIAENSIGNLPCSMTLWGRLSILEARSKQGDSLATRILFTAYKNDLLGDGAFEENWLGLSVDKKWQLLQGLFSHQPTLCTELFCEIVQNSGWILPCECFQPVDTGMTLLGRLSWLERAAFISKNKTAQKILFVAYQTGHFFDLFLTKEYCMKKINKLAQLGLGEAQEYWMVQSGKPVNLNWVLDGNVHIQQLLLSADASDYQKHKLLTFWFSVVEMFQQLEAGGSCLEDNDL